MLRHNFWLVNLEFQLENQKSRKARQQQKFSTKTWVLRQKPHEQQNSFHTPTRGHLFHPKCSNLVSVCRGVSRKESSGKRKCWKWIQLAKDMNFIRAPHGRSSSSIFSEIAPSWSEWPCKYSHVKHKAREVGQSKALSYSTRSHKKCRAPLCKKHFRLSKNMEKTYSLIKIRRSLVFVNQNTSAFSPQNFCHPFTHDLYRHRSILLTGGWPCLG